MSATGLQLHNLQIRHGNTPLLAINHHIPPGEVLTVMGPSGSGKSTLLAALTGTLAPAFTMQGRVVLDGQDVTTLPAHKRRIGLLFQDDLLFPHLSVGANLAFGLSPDIKGQANRRARICAALDDIGLSGFETRDPATLSGGQKARVALMRMLLSDPRALLLDEPFSRLDNALRDQIRALVFDRARTHALPVLMVTHDQADAQAANGPCIQITPQ